LPVNSIGARTIAHSGIAALIAVVVGIASTGCARDVGEASPNPEAPNRTTSNERPSGTTKPPDSVLILGKHMATGVLGSYCWEPASGATEAVCRYADVAGIPVPTEDEALIVPRGWVLVFDYGGWGWSASVDAGAYPLNRGKGWLSSPDRGAPLVKGEGRSALEAKDLRVSRLGERVQIPVKLAAGEYVVEVSARVPEGDATYYFRVVVV
jgi:hypothetical protein